MSKISLNPFLPNCSLKGNPISPTILNKFQSWPQIKMISYLSSSWKYKAQSLILIQSNLPIYKSKKVSINRSWLLQNNTATTVRFRLRKIPVFIRIMSSFKLFTPNENNFLQLKSTTMWTIKTKYQQKTLPNLSFWTLFKKPCLRAHENQI